MEPFRVTGLAVAQIFLLAGIGFFLVKKNLLGHEGLDALSRLVMEVTLPVLIFCQLVRDFTFTAYANWWVFPLASLAVTAAGLAVGALFCPLIKGREHRQQFLSLVGFQNSGYLPLALIAALLPPEKTGPIFIYLFLFLMGFNLLMFSLGVHIMSFHKDRRFELASLFSPPVIAITFTLLFIFFGLNKFMPHVLMKPLNMVGECTLPLAMFVVGGSLAQIELKHIDPKAMLVMALAKLVVLPAIGLWFVLKFNLPALAGLLILIELAAPPATSLSIIVRHYKKEDLLISQGIFFGHVLSLLTIPVFLSLYLARVVIK
jgi:predicted permease